MRETSQISMEFSPEALLLKWRWVVNFYSCMIMVAIYYVYDAPSALSSQTETFLGSNTEFSYSEFLSLEYSLISFAGIPTALCIGLTLDKYGLATCAVVSALLYTLATFAITLGFQFKSEYAVLVGRFVFGLGFQTILTILIVLLRTWMGNQIGIATALLIAAGRAGTVVTDLLSVVIANATSVRFAYYSGLIFIVLVFPVSLHIRVLEKKRQRITTPADECTSNSTTTSQYGDSIIRWIKDGLASFTEMFWLISIAGAIFYSLMFTFNMVIANFLIQDLCNGTCCDSTTITCTAQTDAETTTSYLMTIPYSVAIAMMPIAGRLVDLYGIRGILFMTGFVLSVTAFTLFQLFQQVLSLHITGLVLHGLGIGFTTTAFFPALHLFVPEKYAFFGVSIFQFTISTFGTILPSVISVLGGSDLSDFTSVIPFLLGIAALGLLMSIVINIIDSLKYRTINAPLGDRCVSAKSFEESPQDQNEVIV